MALVESLLLGFGIGLSGALAPGPTLLADALAAGPADAALFLAGHGAADLGWLLLVGAGIARGSAFLPDRTYRLLLGACGIALVALGAAYTATAF